jgi:DNA primase
MCRRRSPARLAGVALYTNDSRDRVRDAVDFAELVSARTELRRAGPARMEGLCPFHDERTPSFGIDPVQKVYYCFGCQASGDVFTFVQETEGVDFKGALELLAERYNVELQREQEDPREEERRRRRERLLELLKRTAGYYERYLWESSEAERAREYLKGRGLQEATLREFRVGYAPSAWDRVLLASRRGGFSEQDLYATGLAQRSKQNGQLYDRFRGRIMFPLTDVRGRVLGFGARAMREDQKPKYLNTSDNDVYHKGLHLYGADLARAHATKAGSVILCEGYTDVIALHQAGMRNAVGLMGTALTAEQVGELSRMAPNVLLALDADTAGQEAMLKASNLARKRNARLEVVPLPPGRDPADLMRDDPSAITSALSRPVPFERFQIERVLARGDQSSADGKQRIIDELRPLFAGIERGALLFELTQVVSSRLALKENAVEQMLAERPATTGGGKGAGDALGGNGDRTATRRSPLSRQEDAERAFLALCIASPEEGAAMLASVNVEEDFSSDLLRRAARHLAAGDLREPMAAVSGNGHGSLDEDPELKGLIAELIVEGGRESVAKPAKLEAQRLQLELARVDRQIQRARGEHSGEVSALAGQRAEVKRQFDRAYGRVLEETGERGY